MLTNQYSFVTVWKIEAPIQAVWDVIYDTKNLPTWWKAVVDIKVIDPGDENGINLLVEQTWRGVLPYRLSLRSKTITINYLKTIEIVASGDLDGFGKWTFTQEGEITIVQYNWEVKTTQKALSFLALFIKPLLAWNHDEIMRWGAFGLAKKLNAKLIEY